MLFSRAACLLLGSVSLASAFDCTQPPPRVRYDNQYYKYDNVIDDTAAYQGTQNYLCNTVDSSFGVPCVDGGNGFTIAPEDDASSNSQNWSADHKLGTAKAFKVDAAACGGESYYDAVNLPYKCIMKCYTSLGWNVPVFEPLRCPQIFTSDSTARALTISGPSVVQNILESATYDANVADNREDPGTAINVECKAGYSSHSQVDTEYSEAADPNDDDGVYPPKVPMDKTTEPVLFCDFPRNTNGDRVGWESGQTAGQWYRQSYDENYNRVDTVAFDIESDNNDGFGPFCKQMSCPRSDVAWSASSHANWDTSPSRDVHIAVTVGTVIDGTCDWFYAIEGGASGGATHITCHADGTWQKDAGECLMSKLAPPP